MDERRREQRFELLAQVRVKRGRVDYVLALTNISRSGVLVHLGSLKEPTWVVQDRVVELGVINPDDLDTVALKGTIVRLISDDDGTSFAVEFEGLDDTAQAGLDRLVELAQRTESASPANSDKNGTQRKGPPPLPK